MLYSLVVIAPHGTAEMSAEFTAAHNNHALDQHDSARYLDRPLTAAGKPYARSKDEVLTRLTDFNDGIYRVHILEKARRNASCLQKSVAISVCFESMV